MFFKTCAGVVQDFLHQPSQRRRQRKTKLRFCGTPPNNEWGGCGEYATQPAHSKQQTHVHSMSTSKRSTQRTTTPILISILLTKSSFVQNVFQQKTQQRLSKLFFEYPKVLAQTTATHSAEVLEASTEKTHTASKRVHFYLWLGWTW